ncbi:MAG: hypothetical protein B6244_12105 [Candidatus Cloacimonetes bacterium 4572_55]|nr:MAG: hypothetical protein B6244_12105 [Candidatus Cloacimonetes bacterium 4572_55]
MREGNTRDRRKYKRLPLNLSIELYTKNHPIDGKYEGRIENMGLGGLLVSLAEELTPEPNRVFVYFYFPTGERFEFVRARVVHGFRSGDRFVYGIAFFVMSPDRKQSLTGCLRELENRPRA